MASYIFSGVTGAR